MKPLILAIFFLSLLGPPARGELVVAESLDWLVVANPDLAVARVVRVESPGENGAQVTAHFRRSRTLRGNPPLEAACTMLVSKSARPGEPQVRPEPGEEYLLVLRGKEIHQAINLTHPVQTGPGVALTTDFKVLSSGADILQAVAARLEKLPTRPPEAQDVNYSTPERGFRRLPVPPNTPAYRVLYSGSGCFLVVPDDSP